MIRLKTINRMRFVLLIFILLATNLFSQDKHRKSNYPISDKITRLIKKYSILKDSINWIELNIELQNKNDSIRLNLIIDKLRQYGDYHAIYFNKSLNNKKTSALGKLNIMPSSKLLHHDIGYFYIPQHIFTTDFNKWKYADTLRKQIQNLDQNNKLKGWIIDVRGNRGGSMWPMIAGLNPLIKDGIVGYFQTPFDHSEFIWKSSSIQPYLVPKMTTIYKCKNLKSKIAILIDSLTVSSGEMTAISLLGMSNSKSFGNHTGSATMTPEEFEFPNGFIFQFGTSYCQDRLRKKYINGIIPDIFVDSLQIIDTAIKWIKE